MHNILPCDNDNYHKPKNRSKLVNLKSQLFGSAYLWLASQGELPADID